MSRLSIATQWIRKLKARGINTYKFNELPDELKSLRAHRRAITEALVERISKKEMERLNTWRVKSIK